ncbi:MAG: hypothetical protein PHD82_17330, partial [Candidatus Riflebacteria bacterium]|nr:hypothetical protein [Candidatus Riflebacteria bacterium]
MKPYHRLRDHSWLLLIILTAATIFTAGCSSSSSDSGGNVNPLGAYQTNTTGTGLPTDGVVQNPGQISSPVISVPTDGSGVNGHDNAPLLDNMHPGWQQASCLSCHNDTTRNPDHNYTDDSLCYLCHGTNGLPGFGDNIPPIISGVVATPRSDAVTITWKSDEECLSRLVLKTVAGDRLEFPVSTTYKTSHKYEINGLLPLTNYTYELICTDKSANRTSTQAFGVLSFTTLEKSATGTSTSGTSPTDPPETNSIFTSLDVTSSGPYKVNVSFTIKEPA